MLDQQKLIVIRNDREEEIEQILDIRTTLGTDPSKPVVVADVLIKGAILPISIPFSELTLPDWERDADMLRVMMQVAEIEEADFAKHPAAVAYMAEHADYMADEQQKQELAGGLW